MPLYSDSDFIGSVKTNTVIQVSLYKDFISPSLYLLGIRCIYLYFLCTGDGGEDGGSGDLWPSLLSWRYLEQTGLFHRYVRVRALLFSLNLP